MRKSQAKRLKAGDRVLWTKEEPHVGGVVTKKRYNTVWIKWDDGVEKTHYADMMDHVSTPEQLVQEAEERRVAEAVKAEAERRRNTHLPIW